MSADDSDGLPPGFRWEKASQHETGAPRALTLDGEEVARLIDKVTGGWFVLLERQRPAPAGQPFAPLVKRDCSSFAQGRRGTEIWAARNEARIRAEVGAKNAARAQRLGLRR
ncbi:MAG TPA: hypothetical protein VD865_17830 [Stenotrophomonas sp.]|nr:hypothetical protein [Stenotrophomonas sp.]